MLANRGLRIMFRSLLTACFVVLICGVGYSQITMTSGEWTGKLASGGTTPTIDFDDTDVEWTIEIPNHAPEETNCVSVPVRNGGNGYYIRFVCSDELEADELEASVLSAAPLYDDDFAANSSAEVYDDSYIVFSDGTESLVFEETITLNSSLDLSEVKELILSPEMKQQLSEEIKKEIKMEFHTSLTWGQWFGIFVLGIIAAKIAHRVTLKTIFKPTKFMAKKTAEKSKETAETIKREWDDA